MDDTICLYSSEMYWICQAIVFIGVLYVADIVVLSSEWLGFVVCWGFLVLWLLLFLFFL